MCGGSYRRGLPTPAAAGLSPRVRGKLVRHFRCGAHPRSIPACAGEATPTPAEIYQAAVYPRVCGGSTAAAARPPLGGGLSPRVRGKRKETGLDYPLFRSIPACAGEAVAAAGGRAQRRVYPRVCGGSPSWRRWRRGRRGLSPRVRGKPMLSRTPVDCVWSIPACAGEACPAPTAHRSGRVYPRVCGGSAHRRFLETGHTGLSPRVRGKPASARRIGARLRSIPACAGEASIGGQRNGQNAVYPRVCGGSEP